MKSFLNVFLPDDEYKRTRILYFMAEGTFISTILLIIFAFINDVWLELKHIDFSFIALIIAVSNIVYIFIRYILSGIEYADVVTEKRYKREVKIILRDALGFGGIFFVLSGVQTGIPSNLETTIDLVVPAIMGGLFFFLLNYISLKRSYKKNKQLFDE
ncbi:MAG TPA: DUF3278 domain-containing protein [Cerasibacillus sp.]|uniref:DUF3278 domain-containing protein n=1 Tax=Cerasibacillus sp. TaxID=2498711 RepID=UPI002F3EE219